ncbi:MAG: sterol desaturase family protein [Polyangiaceae bacterium]|nr:sterol desaturase family protein [Polyangiaceae bacterium]
MDGRAVALAIPLFFLLIGIELIAERRRRARGAEPLYRFADSISSLSCGIGQQVLQALVLTTVGVATYAFAWEKARVFDLDAKSPVTWVVAFVVVDLCYWVYHWASHRVNFLWAMHVVHHSSEEYNLSTALRQSWFTNATSWVFYLPAAFLGIPPMVFLLALTLNILYQFWIHTRAIGKLGFLEAFMNTPSHHRVHHGIDPKYIDKNYGGIFIVWDRLFRTFIAEQEEPSYGTVKPLGSFNPFWANVDLFVYLAKMSAKTKRWPDKILVWLGPPEWQPQDLGGPVTVPPVDKSTRVKYDVSSSRPYTAYICVQFAIVAVILFALLWAQTALSIAETLAGSVVVMAALGVWSGLLERRAWAVPIEFARLATFAAVSILLVTQGDWIGAAGLAVAIGSGVWLSRIATRSAVSGHTKLAA